MDLYVFDKISKYRKKNADDMINLLWTDRYLEIGDFELVLPLNKENIENYKIGDYLSISTIPDRIMIIENIESSDYLEETDTMIITGRSPEYILTNRISSKLLEWTDKELGDIRLELLNDNLISPTDERRKLQGLRTGYIDPSIDSIKITETFEVGYTLYDILYTILNKKDLGMSISYQNEEFIFKIYKGEDRSLSSHDSRVVFSRSFDNLISSTFTQSTIDSRNSAVIEDSTGVIQYYNPDDLTGLDLRELYLSVSEDVTGEAITKKADEELSNYETDYNFECQIESDATTYKYGVDYHLGDIVQVENSYGMSERCVITEYIHSYSENGYESYPTFEVLREDKNNRIRRR